jgi:hypothetical protein
LICLLHDIWPDLWVGCETIDPIPGKRSWPSSPCMSNDRDAFSLVRAGDLSPDNQRDLNLFFM